MSTLQDLQHRLRKSGNPATLVILGISVVIFVISWLTMGKTGLLLSYYSDFRQPWGILTYPFASYGAGTAFIWLLLLFYWFYWVATDSERALGTAKFLAFFAIAALSAIFFLTIGGLLHRTVVIEPGPNLAGLELATAALTVAWGIRNQTACVRLFACIPVSGLILAWLTVGITLFGYGSIYQSPLMGVFACLHLGLAYLFASNRIAAAPYAGPSQASKVLKAQEKRSKDYYEEVRRREQDRAERERLRKLFEGSLKDDPKDDR
jgi:hypothetical protein